MRLPFPPLLALPLLLLAGATIADAQARRPSAAVKPQVAAPAAPAATAGTPLTRTQFIADMDSEFRKMDSNHDGTVTQAEFEAYRRGQLAVVQVERARKAFEALDTDRNGQLSLAEFSKLVTTQSVNVNGSAFMSQVDSNHDGKVTIIENRGATLANFDRLDTDKDGVVSPAEMRAGGVK